MTPGDVDGVERCAQETQRPRGGLLLGLLRRQGRLTAGACAGLQENVARVSSRQGTYSVDWTLSKEPPLTLDLISDRMTLRRLPSCMPC